MVGTEGKTLTFFFKEGKCTLFRKWTLQT